MAQRVEEMASFLERIFRNADRPSSIEPGVYQTMLNPEQEIAHRLHLRVESNGSGVLLLDAATVLHLNPTAAEHVFHIVQGDSSQTAAEKIASRYRVSTKRALEDQQALREQILTLAQTPDLDPVMFLDMEREEPFSHKPSAPYRLDLALTYQQDPDGSIDPLAGRQVDRELDTQEWKRILQVAWEAGIPHVTFTGGEPTRREDLLELIHAGEELGQVTGLLTNGRRLGKPDMITKLESSGLDHILVALELEVPESRQGLEAALHSMIFTGLHLPVNSDREPQYRELLRQLRDKGLQAVSLAAADDSGQAKDTILSLRDYVADLEIDLIWDLPVPYSPNHPIALEMEQAPKGAGSAWLYVEPDGDVLPCQGQFNVLGNMLKDDWPSIWSQAEKFV